MSLTENGNNMVMPVGPMYGNNGGFGFGNGGDGWWIILFLFAMFGGWGNGNGFGNNGNNTFPYMLNTQTQNEVARGFDNAGLNAQISAIQNQLNTNAMALQNCCCENRAGLADLKFTVATEACADRSAVNEALRDVIAANTASTQRILDQLCQDKIDAKNEKIAELQSQLNMATLRESQTAQTAQLLADNSRQTAVLEDYLNPVARPAYIVQNPNCCAQNAACGCGF